ncbi:MAG: DMT family transporter [Reyranellaceae bacterium]
MSVPLKEKFAALSPNMRGALWLIAGSACFTGVTIFIKLLGRELDSVQVAFFRCAFGMFFVLPLIVRQKFALLRSKRHGGHFWRAAIGTASMVMGFYALTHLTLAAATSISFTAPLFVIIVAVLFLGEKVRWRRWTATAIGFIGVLVMMRPGQGDLDPVLLIALLGAALTAVAVCLVKSLTGSENSRTTLVMFTLWSTLFLLGPAIHVWQPPSTIGWIMAAAMGLLATIGQFFVIRAYTEGEATLISPFDYLRLPLSVAAGAWIFAETPSWWTLAGALIIIVSTLYIARREARLGLPVVPEAKSQKIGQ